MKIKKKQNVAQASTKVKGGAKPKANAFKKTGLTLFLTLCPGSYCSVEGGR